MISYIIWDLDPRVFHQFEYLRWYGICWVIGIMAGYQITLRIFRSEGISQEELDRLTTYVVFGAIIGARLGHILFYDPIHYLQHPIEILPIRLEPTFQFTGLAGLASHGGILGALLGLYWYTRKQKHSYLRLLDKLVVAGAALGAFIRFGNLMNSEIIGTPSNLPWAFVFSHVDAVPRHPAQLYEALFYLSIGFLLYFLWKSKKYSQYQGFLFGLGMVLIFVQRFLVEFVKENQVSFEDSLILNIGQLLSIPIVLVGFFLMVWSRLNPQTMIELPRGTKKY